MTRISRKTHARAFTLIEVMLALMLGGIVASVTSYVAVLTVQVEQSARAQMASRWQRMRLLDQFEADLKAALTTLPRDVEVVQINHSGTAAIKIVGLAVIPDTHGLFPMRMPCEISYEVVDSMHKPDTMRVVRKVRDLTAASQSPFGQTIADGVVALRFEQFLSEGGWNTNFRPTEKLDLVAFRILVRWQDRPQHQDVRTVILRDRRNKKKGRSYGPI